MKTKDKTTETASPRSEDAMLRARLAVSERNMGRISGEIRRLAGAMATEALALAPESVRPLIEVMALGPDPEISREDDSDLDWWGERISEFEGLVSGLDDLDRPRAFAALNAVVGFRPEPANLTGATSVTVLARAAESFGVLKFLCSDPDERDSVLSKAGQRAMTERAVKARLANVAADRQIKDAKIIEAKRRWDLGEWPFANAPKPPGKKRRASDFEHACDQEGWGSPSVVRRAIEKSSEAKRHPTD